ncbi:MAG: phosphoribosylanthranilate isomerase [Pirellulales bacterium]|nr:phosphoribosylanthranilate isomerase [Pirellulales bacterium]
MFRIKICGVTTVADARVAVDAGADAIGLNFYPRSSRCVSLEQAREIAVAVGADALVVGVFVNESPQAIANVAAEVGLHALQLHGDEPAPSLAALPSLPLVRARRMGDGGLAELAADLAACRAAGRVPAALLVDAPAVAGQYGGGGEPFAWERIADRGEEFAGVPVILAGGLRPENVAQAVLAARPDGVDVASGVESSPGRKNAELVRQFIETARQALSS